MNLERYFFMDAECFFKEQAECLLLDFCYEETVAKFTVQLYENDEIVQIKAHTKHIYSDFSGKSDGNIAVFNPFFKNLNEELEIKNGVYVPSGDFVQMMNQTRSHLNLAYGLRAKQYKKIAVFNGDFTIAFVPENVIFQFFVP